MKYKYLLYIIFILLFISSCVNSIEYKRLKEDFSDVNLSQYEDIQIDSILGLIPDYSEINKVINELHNSCNSDILINPQNAGLYNNSKEVSIVLGMHIADLGYVRHFEKVQLCSDYIEAIYILSSKLAIGNKELKEMIPKIEENLVNRDQFFFIIDSLINRSKSVLSENEQYGLSALSLGGFWIESIHIGLSSSLLERSERIDEIIHSHFNILKQINHIFQHLEDDSILSDFKGDLEKLRFDENYYDLYLEVDKIRNKYIKPML